MEHPPAHLIERLCRDPSSENWTLLIEFYSPLLHYLAREVLHSPEPDDLVQDTFLRAIQKLPSFTPRRPHDFTRWLSTIMNNRWHDLWRRAKVRRCDGAPEQVDRVAAPADGDDLKTVEYRAMLMERARQIMEARFAPATCKAFRECFGLDRPAAEVAADLGMTVGAVYAAIHRVIRCLQQELPARKY